MSASNWEITHSTSPTLQFRALELSHGLRHRLAVDFGGEDEFVAALDFGQQSVELEVILLGPPDQRRALLRHADVLLPVHHVFHLLEQNTGLS